MSEERPNNAPQKATMATSVSSSEFEGSTARDTFQSVQAKLRLLGRLGSVVSSVARVHAIEGSFAAVLRMLVVVEDGEQGMRTTETEERGVPSNWKVRMRSRMSRPLKGRRTVRTEGVAGDLHRSDFRGTRYEDR